MKRVLLSLFVALAALSFVATDVQAKRLGGGTSSGMKRQAPPTQPAQSTPPQQAATPNANSAAPATAAAPNAAAAAAPKRSWLGPVAGLAAGLGLAALMSHFGLGAELGSLVTLLLLVAVGFFVLRFVLRRFGPNAADPNRASAPNGLQFAGAGAPADGTLAARQEPGFGPGGGLQGAIAAPVIAAPLIAPPTIGRLPAGFDAAAFERIAKLIFIRMQAANDAGNLDDLRQFATPEMFATFRLDLQDRRGTTQQTDVVQLDAQVVDVTEEVDRQIVSVRFRGLIREENNGLASPFDEVWHLTRPADGNREWSIAGIEQAVAA